MKVVQGRTCALAKPSTQIKPFLFYQALSAEWRGHVVDSFVPRNSFHGGWRWDDRRWNIDVHSIHVSWSNLSPINRLLLGGVFPLHTPHRPLCSMFHVPCSRLLRWSTQQYYAWVSPTRRSKDQNSGRIALAVAFIAFKCRKLQSVWEGWCGQMVYLRRIPREMLACSIENCSRIKRKEEKWGARCSHRWGAARAKQRETERDGENGWGKSGWCSSYPENW